MVGRTGLRKDSEKTHFTKGDKAREIVARDDRPYLKEQQQIEEEFLD